MGRRGFGVSASVGAAGGAEQFPQVSPAVGEALHIYFLTLKEDNAFHKQ